MSIAHARAMLPGFILRRKSATFQFSTPRSSPSHYLHLKISQTFISHALCALSLQAHIDDIGHGDNCNYRFDNNTPFSSVSIQPWDWIHSLILSPASAKRSHRSIYLRLPAITIFLTWELRPHLADILTVSTADRFTMLHFHWFLLMTLRYADYFSIDCRRLRWAWCQSISQYDADMGRGRSSYCSHQPLIIIVTDARARITLLTLKRRKMSNRY